MTEMCEAQQRPKAPGGGRGPELGKLYRHWESFLDAFGEYTLSYSSSVVLILIPVTNHKRL